MKLDVEGHEAQVLRGMEAWLSKHRVHVILSKREATVTIELRRISFCETVPSPGRRQGADVAATL
jgi:hypothetical protein